MEAKLMSRSGLYLLPAAAPRLTCAVPRTSLKRLMQHMPGAMRSGIALYSQPLAPVRNTVLRYFNSTARMLREKADLAHKSDARLATSSDTKHLNPHLTLQDFATCTVLSEAVYKMAEMSHQDLLDRINELVADFPSGLIQLTSVQFSKNDVPHQYLMGESGNRLYVAFMGTKRTRDLGADMNWRQETLWTDLRQAHKEELPAAHKGFLYRASTMDSSALLALYHKARDSGRQLVFCGHSLGAAVATLCTLRLLRSLPSQSTPAVSCLCFAAPAVGNTALAKMVHESGWSRFFHYYFLPDDGVMRLVSMAQQTGLPYDIMRSQKHQQMQQLQTSQGLPPVVRQSLEAAVAAAERAEMDQLSQEAAAELAALATQDEVDMTPSPAHTPNPTPNTTQTDASHLTASADRQPKTPSTAAILPQPPLHVAGTAAEPSAGMTEGSANAHARGSLLNHNLHNIRSPRTEHDASQASNLGAKMSPTSSSAVQGVGAAAGALSQALPDRSLVSAVARTAAAAVAAATAAGIATADVPLAFAHLTLHETGLTTRSMRPGRGCAVASGPVVDLQHHGHGGAPDPLLAYTNVLQAPPLAGLPRGKEGGMALTPISSPLGPWTKSLPRGRSPSRASGRPSGKESGKDALAAHSSPTERHDHGWLSQPSGYQLAVQTTAVQNTHAFNGGGSAVTEAVARGTTEQGAEVGVSASTAGSSIAASGTTSSSTSASGTTRSSTAASGTTRSSTAASNTSASGTTRSSTTLNGSLTAADEGRVVSTVTRKESHASDDMAESSLDERRTSHQHASSRQSGNESSSSAYSPGDGGLSSGVRRLNRLSGWIGRVSVNAAKASNEVISSSEQDGGSEGPQVMRRSLSAVDAMEDAREQQQQQVVRSKSESDLNVEGAAGDATKSTTKKQPAFKALRQLAKAAVTSASLPNPLPAYATFGNYWFMVGRDMVAAHDLPSHPEFPLLTSSSAGNMFDRHRMRSYRFIAQDIIDNLVGVTSQSRAPVAEPSLSLPSPASAQAARLPISAPVPAPPVGAGKITMSHSIAPVMTPTTATAFIHPAHHWHTSPHSSHESATPTETSTTAAAAAAAGVAAGVAPRAQSSGQSTAERTQNVPFSSVDSLSSLGSMDDPTLKAALTTARTAAATAAGATATTASTTATTAGSSPASRKARRRNKVTVTVQIAGEGLEICQSAQVVLFGRNYIPTSKKYVGRVAGQLESAPGFAEHHAAKHADTGKHKRWTQQTAPLPNVLSQRDSYISQLTRSGQFSQPDFTPSGAQPGGRNTAAQQGLPSGSPHVHNDGMSHLVPVGSPHVHNDGVSHLVPGRRHVVRSQGSQPVDPGTEQLLQSHGDMQFGPGPRHVGVTVGRDGDRPVDPGTDQLLPSHGDSPVEPGAQHVRRHGDWPVVPGPLSMLRAVITTTVAVTGGGLLGLLMGVRRLVLGGQEVMGQGAAAVAGGAAAMAAAATRPSLVRPTAQERKEGCLELRVEVPEVVANHMSVMAHLPATHGHENQLTVKLRSSFDTHTVALAVQPATVAVLGLSHFSSALMHGLLSGQIKLPTVAAREETSVLPKWVPVPGFLFGLGEAVTGSALQMLQSRKLPPLPPPEEIHHHHLTDPLIHDPLAEQTQSTHSTPSPLMRKPQALDTAPPADVISPTTQVQNTTAAGAKAAPTASQLLSGRKQEVTVGQRETDTPAGAKAASTASKLLSNGKQELKVGQREMDAAAGAKAAPTVSQLLSKGKQEVTVGQREMDTAAGNQEAALQQGNARSATQHRQVTVADKTAHKTARTALSYHSNASYDASTSVSLAVSTSAPAGLDPVSVPEHQRTRTGAYHAGGLKKDGRFENKAVGQDLGSGRAVHTPHAAEVGPDRGGEVSFPQHPHDAVHPHAGIHPQAGGIEGNGMADDVTSTHSLAISRQTDRHHHHHHHHHHHVQRLQQHHQHHTHYPHHTHHQHNTLRSSWVYGLRKLWPTVAVASSAPRVPPAQHPGIASPSHGTTPTNLNSNLISNKNSNVNSNVSLNDPGADRPASGVSDDTSRERDTSRGMREGVTTRVSASVSPPVLQDHHVQAPAVTTPANMPAVTSVNAATSSVPVGINAGMQPNGAGAATQPASVPSGIDSPDFKQVQGRWRWGGFIGRRLTPRRAGSAALTTQQPPSLKLHRTAASCGICYTNLLRTNTRPHVAIMQLAARLTALPEVSAEPTRSVGQVRRVAEVLPGLVHATLNNLARHVLPQHYQQSQGHNHDTLHDREKKLIYGSDAQHDGVSQFQHSLHQEFVDGNTSHQHDRTLQSQHTVQRQSQHDKKKKLIYGSHGSNAQHDNTPQPQPTVHQQSHHHPHHLENHAKSPIHVAVLAATVHDVSLLHSSLSPSHSLTPALHSLAKAAHHSGTALLPVLLLSGTESKEEVSAAWNTLADLCGHDTLHELHLPTHSHTTPSFPWPHTGIHPLKSLNQFASHISHHLGFRPWPHTNNVNSNIFATLTDRKLPAEGSKVTPTPSDTVGQVTRVAASTPAGAAVRSDGIGQVTRVTASTSSEAAVRAVGRGTPEIRGGRDRLPRPVPAEQAVLVAPQVVDNRDLSALQAMSMKDRKPIAEDMELLHGRLMQLMRNRVNFPGANAWVGESGVEPRSRL